MAGPYVAEGFDALTTADLSSTYLVGGSVTVVAGGGRFGSDGLRCAGGGASLSAPVDLADPLSFVMGFAINMGSLGTDYVAQVVDGVGDVPLLTLRINSDGSIDIRQGSVTFGGTLLWGSAPGKIVSGTWNAIEWKGTIDASTGTVSLKVNGELLCALTGQNTGNANITLAIVRCLAATIHFDDWWVCDQSGSRLNDFLGDRIVESVVAEAGNGHYTEWTPSSGSDHGAMVDEATSDGDTTYNAAGSTGLRDTYTFPALTRVESVDALTLSLTARKEGAGARAIAGLTRTGGSDFQDATDHYLADDYATALIALPLNPDTTDPWSVVEVDAAEFGAKVTV